MSNPVAALPVVDMTGWGEASLNPDTFSKGGAATRLNDKTSTIVAISAETRPIGGSGANAAEFKTYVDVTFLPDGEKEPVEQQYDAGSPEFVRVTNDGSALFTKSMRISDSTQWAEFLNSLKVAGYQPQTTKFAEMLGVRVTTGTVEKPYDFTGKDGSRVKGTSTRLLVTKFQGKGAVPAAAAGSASAAPLAAATGDLNAILVGGVLDVLGSAPDNKLKISDLSKAVLKVVTVPATQKGTAAKTLLTEDFYREVPGASVEAGVVSI